MPQYRVFASINQFMLLGQVLCNYCYQLQMDFLFSALTSSLIVWIVINYNNILPPLLLLPIDAAPVHNLRLPSTTTY